MTPTIKRLESFKYLVRYPTVANSSVMLDFTTTVKDIGLTNFLALHMRARPVNDKLLWTWGVLEVKDGEDNYHSLDHLDSDFGMFSVEVLSNTNLPPSHVLIVPGQLSIKRNNSGFLHGTNNQGYIN